MDRPGQMPRVTTARRGLTLAEMLVALGVIGVLVSIVIPVLGSARRAAGETASVARLSGLGTTLEMWCGANDGVYPRVAQGHRYAIGYPSAGVIGTTTLVGGAADFAFIHWPGVIREMFPLSEHAASWISPGRGLALPEQETQFEDRGTIAQFIPSYELCLGFNAAPRLWTPEGAAEAAAKPDAYMTPVRAWMVAHPGGKAMMLDGDMSYDRRPVRSRSRVDLPMLFADGHAAAKDVREATRAFRTELTPPERATARLHNTPHGVLGSDY